MALVDYSYFKYEYLGGSVPNNDFARYEKRAEEMILGLIRKTANEVQELSEDLQTKVKTAICYQIDYLWDGGIETAVSGRAYTGFTVGKVSVQAGAGAGLSGAKSMICPAVYALLETTGLLNPAVDTGAEPWPATRGWL